MTVFQKFLLVSIAALLFLAACDAELDELPTPTPVDAALQRLDQEEAEDESVEESEAEEPADEPEAEAAGSDDLEAVFAASGCVACHAVVEDAPPGVGPNVHGVVGRAEEAIASADYTGEAETVEEYLRESILNPRIFIEPDYDPLMPTTYGDTLTDEQIDQLVTYMQGFE
ncbi:MAG: c-type cytochrome [Anaerolineae bacterium]|nr:c-type cytochrome [Anaerolineae bacterium]